MKDELKNLFKQVLGSDVTIKDNINIDEKSFFCLMVNKLDQTHKDDESLFALSGVDLTKITLISSPKELYDFIKHRFPTE